MEEQMAPHCSILAWAIPRTEEPGGLQSMGSPGRQSSHRPAPKGSISRGYLSALRFSRMSEYESEHILFGEGLWHFFALKTLLNIHGVLPFFL